SAETEGKELRSLSLVEILLDEMVTWTKSNLASFSVPDLTGDVTLKDPYSNLVRLGRAAIPDLISHRNDRRLTRSQASGQQLFYRDLQYCIRPILEGWCDEQIDWGADKLDNEKVNRWLKRLFAIPESDYLAKRVLNKLTPGNNVAAAVLEMKYPKKYQEIKGRIN
ncbi:MAG: hypothetical protein ABL962_18045, partial [Fimbriimonadaceae bacterium]